MAEERKKVKVRRLRSSGSVKRWKQARGMSANIYQSARRQGLTGRIRGASNRPTAAYERRRRSLGRTITMRDIKKPKAPEPNVWDKLAAKFAAEAKAQPQTEPVEAAPTSEAPETPEVQGSSASLGVEAAKQWTDKDINDFVNKAIANSAIMAKIATLESQVKDIEDAAEAAESATASAQAYAPPPQVVAASPAPSFFDVRVTHNGTVEIFLPRDKTQEWSGSLVFTSSRYDEVENRGGWVEIPGSKGGNRVYVTSANDSNKVPYNVSFKEHAVTEKQTVDDKEVEVVKACTQIHLRIGNADGNGAKTVRIYTAEEAITVEQGEPSENSFNSDQYKGYEEVVTSTVNALISDNTIVHTALISYWDETRSKYIRVPGDPVAMLTRSYGLMEIGSGGGGGGTVVSQSPQPFQLRVTSGDGDKKFVEIYNPVVYYGLPDKPYESNTLADNPLEAYTTGSGWYGFGGQINVGSPIYCDLSELIWDGESNVDSNASLAFSFSTEKSDNSIFIGSTDAYGNVTQTHTGAMSVLYVAYKDNLYKYGGSAGWLKVKDGAQIAADDKLRWATVKACAVQGKNILTCLKHYDQDAITEETCFLSYISAITHAAAHGM